MRIAVYGAGGVGGYCAGFPLQPSRPCRSACMSVGHSGTARQRRDQCSGVTSLSASSKVAA